MEVPGSNLRRLVAKATVITKLRDLCAVDVSRSHALERPWPAYHAPLAQVQRAIRGLGAAQPIPRDVFGRGGVTGGAWWRQCRDVSSDQRGRCTGTGRLAHPAGPAPPPSGSPTASALPPLVLRAECSFRRVRPCVARCPVGCSRGRTRRDGWGLWAARSSRLCHTSILPTGAYSVLLAQTSNGG